jgi:hypothetical protein
MRFWVDSIKLVSFSRIDDIDRLDSTFNAVLLTGILIERRRLEEEKSLIWRGFGVDGSIWIRSPTFEGDIFQQVSIKISEKLPRVI